MQHQFNYATGQLVKIKASGEEGYIIGAATYETSEDAFLIRYRAADGRAVESWWSESALE